MTLTLGLSPSTKELTLLCGLANQDANVFNDSYGADNRVVINLQLAKVAGSTQIVMHYYGSPTQSLRDDQVWRVHFIYGSTDETSKDREASFRVVSAF